MKKNKLFSALLLLTLPMLACAQQNFSTPEQASSALVDAVTTQNHKALDKILGDDWDDFLPAENRDPAAVARFLRDWKVSHHIEQEGNKAHINVGADDWQLPLPIVKNETGWHFDTKGATDEILTRTIGLNELSAIEAMYAYVQAQGDYYALNNIWAQRILSRPGTKDGLYWPTEPGDPPSPLGPAFTSVVPAIGYHGYHFRILTRQGTNAEGGEQNYVNNGKMDKGFALIAWPVEYGKTGVMSFIINQDDVVWQRDFGDKTTLQVNAITQYDPDHNWHPVDNEVDDTESSTQ